jgi:hypothetical protein
VAPTYARPSYTDAVGIEIVVLLLRY